MGPIITKSEQDLIIRQQLNLKNLKRHDIKIKEIISSTSYTTVYYNNGLGWVKTNIEGPMFLYSREIAPFHGFFILNRNGLEYVNEFLTPDSEIRIDGEFILFEPHSQADRATGIWVYEEKERSELCKRMEELRLQSIPPPKSINHGSQSNVLPSPTIPYNQSITLDYLFASATSNSSHASNSSLRSNQSPPDLPPKSLPQLGGGNKHPTGMSLLDSIFKSASQPTTSTSTPISQTPIPQSQAQQQIQQQPIQKSQRAPPTTAASLLAMISPKPVYQTAPIPSISNNVTSQSNQNQNQNQQRRTSTNTNSNTSPSQIPQRSSHHSTSSIDKSLPPHQLQQPITILQRPSSSSTNSTSNSNTTSRPTTSQNYKPISIPPSPSKKTKELVNVASNVSSSINSQPPSLHSNSTQSKSSSTSSSLNHTNSISSLGLSHTNDDDDEDETVILMDQTSQNLLPIFAAPLLSHDLFDLLPKGSQSSLNGKSKSSSTSTTSSAIPTSTSTSSKSKSPERRRTSTTSTIVSTEEVKEKFPVLVPSLGTAEAARREKERLAQLLAQEKIRSDKLEQDAIASRATKLLEVSKKMEAEIVRSRELERERQRMELKLLAEERRRKVLEREELDRVAFEREEAKLLKAEEEMRAIILAEEKEKEREVAEMVGKNVMGLKNGSIFLLDGDDHENEEEEDDELIITPVNKLSTQKNKKTSISINATSIPMSPSTSNKSTNLTPTSRKNSKITLPLPTSSPTTSNSLLLSSKDVNELLNESIKKNNIGMEGNLVDDDDEDDEAEVEALSKAEFMKLVKDCLSKSSFTTALYSSYLARFAEQLERDEDAANGL